MALRINLGGGSVLGSVPSFRPRSIVGAQPKEINIYNSTVFGSNLPADNQPFYEYEPPGPIDFMRYRMNRIWNKVWRSNHANIGA